MIIASFPLLLPEKSRLPLSPGQGKGTLAAVGHASRAAPLCGRVAGMGKGTDSDPPSQRGGERWTDMAEVEVAADAARWLARQASAPSEIEARRRALDLIDPRPGEIIIDVGAGSGIFTLEIAARVAPGGRVFAVDASGAMLAHARAAAGAAGFGAMIDCRVADGRKLPFGPAAFDAAVTHWVLVHVDQPGVVIDEMRRVTRRGGRVMCVEMDFETMVVHPAPVGLTRRILHHSQSRQVDAWSGRRLSPLFREAGLSDVTVEPIVDVDEGKGNRVWLDYLIERAGIAWSGALITAEEAEAWTAGLEEAFAAGRFFFSVTQFAVIGRVAE